MILNLNQEEYVSFKSGDDFIICFKSLTDALKFKNNLKLVYAESKK